MVKDDIKIQAVKGQLHSSVFKEVLDLYASVFEDADLAFFTNRLKENPDAYILLAFSCNKLIGFKIGYPYNKDTFYSWIGGVLPSFRKKGIASKLLNNQELYAKELGFKKMRTKSMNRFKPMMILNLKNNYNIVKIYTNSKQQTKIVFEKTL